MPRTLLRLEGAAVLAGALALYFDRGYGWLALVLLVLAPDVSMLGYLAGPKVGARAYDLVHTEVPKHLEGGEDGPCYGDGALFNRAK